MGRRLEKRRATQQNAKAWNSEKQQESIGIHVFSPCFFKADSHPVLFWHSWPQLFQDIWIFDLNDIMSNSCLYICPKNKKGELTYMPTHIGQMPRELSHVHVFSTLLWHQMASAEKIVACLWGIVTSHSYVRLCQLETRIWDMFVAPSRWVSWTLH